jgi:hypothetical protein
VLRQHWSEYTWDNVAETTTSRSDLINIRHLTRQSRFHNRRHIGFKHGVLRCGQECC